MTRPLADQQIPLTPRQRRWLKALGRPATTFNDLLVDEASWALTTLDDCYALLRLPGRDNDGGPGDLVEELRLLLHNLTAAEDRAMRVEAELAKARAALVQVKQGLH